MLTLLLWFIFESLPLQLGVFWVVLFFLHCWVTYQAIGHFLGYMKAPVFSWKVLWHYKRKAFYDAEAELVSLSCWKKHLFSRSALIFRQFQFSLTLCLHLCSYMSCINCTLQGSMLQYITNMGYLVQLSVPNNLAFSQSGLSRTLCEYSTVCVCDCVCEREKERNTAAVVRHRQWLLIY